MDKATSYLITGTPKTPVQQFTHLVNLWNSYEYKLITPTILNELVEISKQSQLLIKIYPQELKNLTYTAKQYKDIPAGFPNTLIP